MSVTVDGHFRTDNLALAVVLSAAGFRFTLERMNSTKACWAFDPPVSKQEDFDDIVEAFHRRGCKVEPLSFLIEHQRMRKDLFAFLNGDGSGVPSAVTVG